MLRKYTDKWDQRHWLTFVDRVLFGNATPKSIYVKRLESIGRIVDRSFAMFYNREIEIENKDDEYEKLRFKFGIPVDLLESFFLNAV